MRQSLAHFRPTSGHFLHLLKAISFTRTSPLQFQSLPAKILSAKQDPPKCQNVSSICWEHGGFPWALGDFLHAPKQCVLTSLCLTLRNPMDCSPPGSSVCEIFLARILKGVATLSSRGSSRPRNRTHVSCGSCIAGRFFTAEPLKKPPPKQVADPLCLRRMLASFVHFLWYYFTSIIF